MMTGELEYDDVMYPNGSDGVTTHFQYHPFHVEYDVIVDSSTCQ